MSQFMVLSLPSSGTDWICGIIARHGRVEYYQKEFFNPICNPLYREELSRHFGCELPGTMPHIAEPGTIAIMNQIYQETWENHGYTMDKEVWSPFKLDWFKSHFQCLLMYRRMGSVFPPGRLRVWQWYDCIYHSLVQNGRLTHKMHFPLRARAELAHAACWKMMLTSGLPVISYDTMVWGTEEDITKEIEATWIPRVIDP